jgi:hypothetical protein
MLVGLATVMARGQSWESSLDRLPRHVSSPAAAVQGIVRNSLGLGLGGVRVDLWNVSASQSVQAITTGDGVFRFLNLSAGHYQLTGGRPGFEPMQRTEIQLNAGEVFGFEETLRAVGPELVARAAPAPSPAYRSLPDAAFAGPVIEARPPEPLPPAEKVFSPMPDRWKYEWPRYRRYGAAGENPYVKGHFYDPFNQNKFKGDEPILGQRTFLNLTFTNETQADGRLLPTPSNVPSANPGSQNFFGGFGQFALRENLGFSFDLFHGDASFRPIDWRVKLTPEVNVNYLAVQETGIVNVDPRAGTTRLDAHAGLQEAFAEIKLKDLSHAYDFVSLRAGIQTFNSDFRGFIFSDQEPGARIFGNLQSNRYQYNAAYFAMLEKNTNSGLNTFAYRHQQVWVANLYRQDFLKPGYTIQASFHYDKDDPSFAFDTNNFLVRPAPIGVVTPHAIRAYYYGLTGDGHIGRLNLTHAFYQVLGHDSLQPIAGKRTDINAQMGAVELSLDKDWIRYRVSVFYASGDKNPRDGTARGFDSIFDNSNFAGGFFSFWYREGIRLTSTGVGLTEGQGLLPSLRSSKSEGQANFVNPGVLLYNAGVDVDLTPKLRGFVNLNLIRFVHVEPLELLLFQNNIHAGVGADSGLGFSYRPPLSENIVIMGVFNVFEPFQGFRDIYTGRTLLGVAGIVRFRF